MDNIISLENTETDVLQMVLDQYGEINTTPDDLPEKKVSIYDLVNQEDLIPYPNLSGRSNINGYRYSDEWFLVRFKDNSFYLYTLKSLEPDLLNSLKVFAESGTGLNSFISKKIRSNYAIKKIKGELIVRPGMESYSCPDVTLYLHL